MNQSFEHLVAQLQAPWQAGWAGPAAEFNARRRRVVEEALRVRPHFLPVTHTLPAAASTSPVSRTTEELNHPVIVHGAITDGEDRNVRLFREYEARALVRYGSDAVSKLSLDAIAGHSRATAGFPGVREFPQPYLIEKGNGLTLEMFQETNPGAEEIVSTVFCGTRVFASNAAEATMTEDVRRSVDYWIKVRPAPETVYGVVAIAFAADGTASAETPRADEPLLIRGFRCTFTDALINIGFDGDNSFAKSKFPIWALCAEPDSEQKLYEMLKTPLFVPAGEQPLFSLKNTIDGNLFATDGNIEILYQTV